jgi:hypothetical protein
MLTEFARPELTMRMLDNAIAVMAMSFIVMTAVAAAIALVGITWECAGLLQEPARSRRRKQEDARPPETPFLPSLPLRAVEGPR